MQPKSKVELKRRDLLIGMSVATPLLYYIVKKSLDLLSPTTFRSRAPLRPEDRLKYFIFMFTPFGFRPGERPTSTGGQPFQLPPAMFPLNSLKEQLLMLNGLKYTLTGNGDQHQQGIGQSLTGANLLSGGPFANMGDGKSGVGWASSLSLDQYLAKKLGEHTFHKTIQLSIGLTEYSVNSRISYTGPNQPVSPENHPYGAFLRYFSSPQLQYTSKLKVEQMIARQKSVLDSVTDDLKGIQPLLSKQESLKIQLHFDAIRELEQRLMPHDNRCSYTKEKDLRSSFDSRYFKDYALQHVDLIANAFKCHLSHVATLMFFGTGAGAELSGFGIPTQVHTVSHMDSAEGNEFSAKLIVWYSEVFAKLIQSLATIPDDEGGTVLDKTALVWGSDLAVGYTHEVNNLMFILGGGTKVLSSGRVMDLSSEGRNANDLLLSLSHLYGMDTPTFGVADYCRGPIDAIFKAPSS